MNSPHNFNTLPSTNNNNLLIIVGDNNGVAHSANHHSSPNTKPLSFSVFLLFASKLKPQIISGP